MSQRIYYYSTNRNLAGIPGLVPWKKSVSFREALLLGQAPDEGLFMPDPIPVIPMQSIMALQGTPYTGAAMLVATAFLADEIHSEALEKIVSRVVQLPDPHRKSGRPQIHHEARSGTHRLFQGFCGQDDGPLDELLP